MNITMAVFKKAQELEKFKAVVLPLVGGLTDRLAEGEEIVA